MPLLRFEFLLGFVVDYASNFLSTMFRFCARLCVQTYFNNNLFDCVRWKKSFYTQIFHVFGRLPINLVQRLDPGY